MKNLCTSFALLLLVSLTAHAQCTASFTYSGDPSVNFSSTCSGATQPAYTWNFGNSGYSNLPNPTVTYSYAGNYTITLTYSDTLTSSCNATATAAITITNAPNPPCNAGFSNWVDTSNSQVVFNSVNNAYIVKWVWDFGDGNKD